MGVVDWLLRRKDPSSAWKADPRRTLELDLDAATLCGVGLGASVEGLAVLGPPENPWPSRTGAYRWPSRGIEVDTDGGRVTALVFVWSREPGAGSFPGRITWHGTALPLGATTRRGDLERIFGPPYHVDDDEDEPTLYYQHGDVGWAIDFAVDKGLAELGLERPGLYADPEWRRKHGITRPWPPAIGEGAPR